MDQFICASLSDTHHWYEVGMLKVSAIYTEGKNVRRTLISIQRENGKGTKNTRKKSTSPNKQKEIRKKHVVSGHLHLEGRLNEGPRLQQKHKKDENEAKLNKGNIERRYGVCKPNAQI